MAIRIGQYGKYFNWPQCLSHLSDFHAFSTMTSDLSLLQPWRFVLKLPFKYSGLLQRTVSIIIQDTNQVLYKIQHRIVLIQWTSCFSGQWTQFLQISAFSSFCQHDLMFKHLVRILMKEKQRQTV